MLHIGCWPAMVIFNNHVFELVKWRCWAPKVWLAFFTGNISKAFIGCKWWRKCNTRENKTQYLELVKVNLWTNCSPEQWCSPAGKGTHYRGHNMKNIQQYGWNYIQGNWRQIIYLNWAMPYWYFCYPSTTSYSSSDKKWCFTNKKVLMIYLSANQYK